MEPTPTENTCNLIPSLFNSDPSSVLMDSADAALVLWLLSSGGLNQTCLHSAHPALWLLLQDWAKKHLMQVGVWVWVGRGSSARMSPALISAWMLQPGPHHATLGCMMPEAALSCRRCGLSSNHLFLIKFLLTLWVKCYFSPSFYSVFS